MAGTWRRDHAAHSRGVTTAPAATTQPSFTDTPGRMVALEAIQEPLPMVTGLAMSFIARCAMGQARGDGQDGHTRADKNIGAYRHVFEVLDLGAGVDEAAGLDR
ncbi:MAG: hypothetical protein R2693_11670 [Nocardioidaceae bacterium]